MDAITRAIAAASFPFPYYPFAHDCMAMEDPFRQGLQVFSWFIQIPRILLKVALKTKIGPKNLSTTRNPIFEEKSVIL